MKVVVKKRFKDKYTDEVYEAGSELELTHERYAEIKATDANLVVAVVEEEQAAGQQGAADSETEEQTTGQQEAAGQTKPKRAKKQDKQDE